MEAAATLAKLLAPYGWNVVYAVGVLTSLLKGSNANADVCSKMFLVDDEVLDPEDFLMQ